MMKSTKSLGSLSASHKLTLRLVIKQYQCWVPGPSGFENLPESFGKQVSSVLSPVVLATCHKSSPSFRELDFQLDILAKFFITYCLVFASSHYRYQ